MFELDNGMSDLVAIANFQTKAEAEMAGGLLDAAGIPFVIQSTEGILHGPINPGATVLVGDAAAAHARAVLGKPPGDAQPEDAA